jgi:hypothetical protein
MFRSLGAAIAAHPVRERVREQVSPEARALLDDLPLATAWIDARLINEVYEALYRVLGETELRRLNYEAVEHGVTPLVRGAVERLLRVFGVSPATLLSKFERIAGTTARGVVYRYESLGETSGRFDIEYPALSDVPLGPFVATGGALELVFAICGVRGTIRGLAFVPNGRNNRIRYDVEWQPMRPA